MGGKGNISDYRRKLDKTLALSDLTNDETVCTLVKDQILRSSNSDLGDYPEYVIEKRSKELCNFLAELRSASVTDVEMSKTSDESHGGWKVKQDTDELRVMYREGPQGTPFHTLLAEGYVDGPVDVCLCISCEADLYKIWWPQIAIPTFKVTAAQCVQKVRTGEQISLVRMKVTWPLSSREVLIHYFAFEYFQDGLIVVLLNSIPESDNIDKSTHGFTREGIPEAQDAVRMDLYGGFALQKVSDDRSYFRTIANMDIKLDFVPPALINFIARQLIGSGFKLYKKEVASVAKGGKKFREALKDPLYTHVHEALYSKNTSMASVPLDNTSSTLAEQSGKALEDNTANEKNELDDRVIDSEMKDVGVRNDEIEAIEEKDSDRSKSCDSLINEITEVRADKTEVVESAEVEQGDKITEYFGYDTRTKVGISPEVQRALRTLETAISMFREYNTTNPENGGLNLEDDAREVSISSEAEEIRKKNGTCVESSNIGSAKLTSHAPRNSSDNHGSRSISEKPSSRRSNSYARETNQSKIAPSASPDEGRSTPSHIKHINLHSENVLTVSESMPVNHSLSLDANTIGENSATKRMNKKLRFCCLNFVAG